MITVLGATGNIGRHVVGSLIANGERPRVVTRDRTKISWSVDDVDLYEGDLRSDEFRARALAGTDKIFTLSFVEEQPPLLPEILSAARKAGVGHIVLLSSVGASSSISIGRKHAEAEEAVRSSGIASTFLRPGYLMSNTLRWASGIRRDGRVATPAADGAINPIAERDVATAAAISLTQNGHEGCTYVLTGEQITARRQVEVLSKVLGYSIECLDMDPDEAAANLLRLGRPSWVVDGLRSMWMDVRDGRGAHRDEAFKQLTGHAATTYREWAEENHHYFE